VVLYDGLIAELASVVEAPTAVKATVSFERSSHVSARRPDWLANQ